jgi:hypothetical protein
MTALQLYRRYDAQIVKNVVVKSCSLKTGKCIQNSTFACTQNQRGWFAKSSIDSGRKRPGNLARAGAILPIVENWGLFTLESGQKFSADKVKIC